MGTLFSTFSIAQSGLQAAQIQIEVASHNIANVNREGYTRQRADLTSVAPLIQPYGALGRGVAVSGVERLRMSFLDAVYRQQSPELGSAEVRASYFVRIEDLFQEPSEHGFGSNLDLFFNSLHDFAGNVEQQPVRMSVITEAQNLASSFNLLARQIYTLRSNANDEIRNMAPEINSIAEQIALLNVRIGAGEVGGATMNDLRDDRDMLLDQLSRYVNFSYRERTNGQIDVMVGNDALVEGMFSHAVVAERDPSLDPDRVDLVTLRFAATGRPLSAQGGRLHGAMTVRDSDLVDLAARIDRLASTLISEINAIHAGASGISKWSGVVHGTNGVTDPAAPLVSGVLPFDVRAGTFNLNIYHQTGAKFTSAITIGPGTTLADLAAAIDSTLGMSAHVSSDGRLVLASGTGFSFCFSDDATGALVALGVNGLFTGSKAGNMGVNQDIVDNPRLLASGYSIDLLDTGDNKAALDMANLQTRLVIDGTASLADYYQTTIVRVGIQTRANQQTLRIQQTFVDDIQRRRQEVSGVSIDEEVTNMLKFQRAYEASARVISVVDRMIETLLNAFG